MINFPRNSTQHLQSLFAAFPVVVVTGARQVGKTTLLRQVFPNLDYVVFDASLDLEQARSEPDLFLRNHPAPLILDEIQYAPELVASIKRAVDAQHAKPGQFLLTGSQQWQVMQALAESLAGRVAFVELSGLSLSELTHTQPQTASSLWLHRWMQAQEQGTQQAFADHARAAPSHTGGLDMDSFYAGNLQEWLWRGFMPKAQTLDLGLVPDFWQGYHRTYVERDARLAGEVGLARLWSLCAPDERAHSARDQPQPIGPRDRHQPQNRPTLAAHDAGYVPVVRAAAVFCQPHQTCEQKPQGLSVGHRHGLPPRSHEQPEGAGRPPFVWCPVRDRHGVRNP